MKIVFAPDSYKGSLTAGEICGLLKEKAELIFPGCETVGIPVSDGGEGALDVVVSATKGSYREKEVSGPMGRRVRASYGLLPEKRAMIEMASASGLPLVKPEERNILAASTYGTGELIADALDCGIRRFCIAIGGSATNDGGIGAAAALGARFLDKNGAVLEPVAESLGRIESIELSGLHPAVAESEFTVMCDVTNPLLGETGATYVFGPQKGAGEAEMEILESGMTNYAACLKRTFGKNFADIPGAGAAGGLGVGLMAFCGASLQSGIDAILNILDFEQAIAGADLVVTGEGRMDFQSVFGKVPSGVGKAAKKQGIPCVAIVGGMGTGAENIYGVGVDSIITTINGAMPVEEAIEHAQELFSGAAERMFRMIRTGMNIGAQR